MTELAERTPPRPRRRALACQRCRRRKVRCDALLPSCSNCSKANVPCEDAQGVDRSHTFQLENRVQWLEGILKNVAPEFCTEDYESSSQGMIFSPTRPQVPSQQPTAAPNLYDFTPQPQHSVSEQYGFEGELPSLHAEAAVNSTTASIVHDAHPTPRGSGPSPATPSAASHISSEQPLAQSVGLISLGHSSDPKYLGPSSGVSFARLVFAAAPPSQGLPLFSSHFSTTLGRIDQRHAANSEKDVKATPLPSSTEVSHFVSAYVDAFHHLYPFMSQSTIEKLVDQSEMLARQSPSARDTNETKIGNADRVILYLVVGLGARTLETQMSADFSAAKYLETAMELIALVPIHESTKGVQIMLLLALASFIFPSAPNAWFLVSTIIASCVDLGLQRKQYQDLEDAEQNTRRGIFWSAYSLDRTLCTILGRPLTLRDEAIDIEYPGKGGSIELNLTGLRAATAFSSSRRRENRDKQKEPTRKRIRLEEQSTSPYEASVLSFRFDRIVAEIKLMIYRVAQIPERFPWPQNLTQWQQDAHSALRSLIEETRHVLRPSKLFNRSCYSDQVLPSLELKYHHCIMVLFRPSPAFPRPSPEALRYCYESAGETIRIHSDLLRFGRLNNSWLAAHTVFVSGITMLYYGWSNPHILQNESSEFYARQRSCSDVLSALGRTWSVAKDAQEKIDRLLEITKKERIDSGRDIVGTNNATNASIDPMLNGEEEVPTDGAYGVANDCLGSINATWDAPTALWDELGEMKSWFDLEWFGDNLDLSAEYNFE